MSNNPYEVLRAAGANLDVLPAGQRKVFEDLSPEELEVISAVQARLNAATPEVIGQSADSNNCLC